MFCYSPDTDIPSKIQRVVDEVGEEGPRNIGDTIGEMMASLSRIMSSAPIHYETASEDEDNQSSAADYEPYDAYDEIVSLSVEPNSIKAKLQE